MVVAVVVVVGGVKVTWSGAFGAIEGGILRHLVAAATLRLHRWAWCGVA